MENLKVGQVIIYKQVKNTENIQKFSEIVKNKKINIKIIDENTSNKPLRIHIEKNIYFDIIWPSNKKMILKNEINNNSIVCKLYYKDFSILFTGDIEEEAEREILETYKENLEILNSTILKVAHHGSNTSTTQDFLNAVKPKIALIGVGENNKFGHPNLSVLERLENIRL